MRLRLIALSVASLMISSPASSATFTCLAHMSSGDDGASCTAMALAGKITAGDAVQFERYLARMPLLRRLYLWSPGGNVREALQIGRLVRANFLSVWANRIVNLGDAGARKSCGTVTTPPCCASACSLVYYGGAAFISTDMLGLHRPSVDDMGRKDFDAAQSAIRLGRELIRLYLEEMEADPTIFRTMMEAGPDQLAVTRVTQNPRGGYFYPPTIRDWLEAKCGRHPKGDDREACMGDAFYAQQTLAREQWLEGRRIERRDHQEMNRIDKVSIAEIEKYTDANPWPTAAFTYANELLRKRSAPPSVKSDLPNPYNKFVPPQK